MLLKMAVNAIECSTFEDQYGKSTSTRTTAMTFRAPLTDHMISRMRRNSYGLYYALYWQLTLITFFVEPCTEVV